LNKDSYQPTPVDAAVVAILSSLAYDVPVALCRVGDGASDTVNDTHVLGVFAHGTGGVEVLDNIGRRVGFVPGRTQQVFRACSSEYSTASSEYDYGYGPFWVAANVGDTAGSYQGTTTYRQPIHGTTGVTSVDVDGATITISSNTVSTAFSSVATISGTTYPTTINLTCASSLGGSDWAVASSWIEQQYDQILLNWASAVCDQFSSPFIEMEDALNRMVVGLAAAGISPGLGYAQYNAGDSVALTSQSTDYEGDWTGTSIATGDSVDRASGLGASAVGVNKFGKYIASSDVNHVSGALDFDVAVVLPNVGGAATTLSTYAATTGNFFTVTNTAAHNTIYVQDSYGHALYTVRPQTAAVFQAVSSNWTTENVDEEQWALTNARLVPGWESFTDPKSCTLRSTTVWGPVDLSTVLPQVSCLNTVGNITSLSTAAYSTDTDSTAMVAAMEYVLGQMASMNKAAFAKINHSLDMMGEVAGAFDLVTYTT
jgi:hypothetical protein